METKICRKCSIEKPLSDFARCKRATGPVGKGVVGTCKKCFNQYARDTWYPSQGRKFKSVYYQTHITGIRAYVLRRSYGITPERYDTMLAAQGGHCAICPAKEPGGRGKFFHVDHDHTTGKVRGLLCHRCNTALGLFQDSPAALKLAIKYLGPP